MGNILIVVSSNTMLCKIYAFCFADFNIRVGVGSFCCFISNSSPKSVFIHSFIRIAIFHSEKCLNGNCYVSDI